MGKLLISILVGALAMFYADDWKNNNLSVKQALSVVQNGTQLQILAKD